MKKYLLVALSLLLPFGAMAKEGFNHEGALSVIVESGNSDTESYLASTKNWYEWDKSVVTVGGHYNFGESESVIDTRNWNAYVRYDWRFDPPRWSLFVAQGVEGDPFAGYDYRYNTDLGVRYVFWDSEPWFGATELGYRFSHEKRTDRTVEDLNNLRWWLEIKYAPKDENEYGFNVEYIPAFENFSDYKLNYELFVNMRMNSIFFMKFSYQGRYDNMPPAGVEDNLDTRILASVLSRI